MWLNANWATGNTTSTGTNRTTSPAAAGTTVYNVSALLFLLVRADQSPWIFVCPSTLDTPDPNTKTGTTYNWDFSPFKDGRAEHVSYSYQAPLGSASGTTTTWSSGVTGNSDAGLAILADRTHYYDGYNTTPGNWASMNKPARYMSQNHGRGEVINVLYAGLNVGDSTRADCGVHSDAIYYAATGDQETSQTGSNSMADRIGPAKAKDSFLVGPVKMP
jgi:hypothetical protein